MKAPKEKKRMDVSQKDSSKMDMVIKSINQIDIIFPKMDLFSTRISGIAVTTESTKEIKISNI